MTVDLDELERLARALDGDRWEQRTLNDGQLTTVHSTREQRHLAARYVGEDESIRFIAKANPEAVLWLVALARLAADSGIWREPKGDDNG